MAILDYKIVDFSHDKRHVKATVRLYTGEVTTEPETFEDTTQDVTRYRRTAKVAEKTYEYDVPRDMTKEEFLRKGRAYLNKKLQDYATANGHTVIDEQLDLTDFEDFDTPENPLPEPDFTPPDPDPGGTATSTPSS